MPEKFVCTMSKEELERLYWDDGKTYVELCPIIGVKSPITVAKILHEKGIDTNRNAAIASKNRKGMSDVEFKAYLISEYKDKSIKQIARELGINQVVIRRYFEKYGIQFKPTNEAKGRKGEKNKNWNGGRFIRNGYIEVYAPDHPRRGTRNYMYEHIIIMENHLGRYLEPGEVVHHKDLCKTNNDIDNLLLMTHSEHMKLHHQINRERKKGNNGA